MVQIEFISSELITKTRQGKVDYLLAAVKKGDKIIVLEEPLTPQEETELIKKTMEVVDRNFTGIEVATLGSASVDIKTHLVKLLGGRAGGLTVVGPSKLVKEIKRDPNKLNLLAHK